MPVIATRDGAQIVRLGGVEVDTIRPADFDTAKSADELSADLAARVEANARDAGQAHTVLIHVFDKAGANYLIGIRPPGWTLPKQAADWGYAWWEWTPPFPDGPKEDAHEVEP